MRTLLDVLHYAVEVAPQQVIVQTAADGGERELTYGELLEESLRVAAGLHAAGVEVRTPLIVLAGTSTDFLPSFWGALAAGLMPVPLAPTPDKVAAVWAHLGRPPLLVGAELASSAQHLLGAGVSSGPGLLALDQLRLADPTSRPHSPDPDEVAFLQFSSGSTGAPKGVVLSHANVVANLRQARLAGAATASDVMVSWLPYFHDMGLIGAHLTPLSLQIKQVKLDPGDFAARPALWYETAARHSATLLPTASFALALTVRRVPAPEVAELDLSAVRLMGVGAEPIPVPMWRTFLTHLRPSGLRPSALVPLYGLAEATLAVTFPPLGEVARPLALDRQALSEGRAVDVEPATSGRSPAEFLDVGYPVPDTQLRIVGDDGQVLAESLVGHIELRGPNVAAGYVGRPEETSRAFVDGWLRTGDLGFLRGGRLCVTGRAKDVIFISGQKFHASDLEQVVATTPGLPPGRVAVVGFPDPVSGAERVAVLVSSREPPGPALAPVLTAVRARVREALAYADVCVLPISPDDVPRTTSGKIQRSVLRERLVAGRFAALETQVATWMSTAATVPRGTPPPTRPDIEARITRIWAEVLEVPASSISREDRFLAIGGSSLAAMQVLSQLEATFGGPLPPSLLRDCATVAALAEELSGRTEPEPALAGTATPAPADPAAIIGMACRFPDADTPEAFWQNLAASRDSVTEVPPSRWRPAPGARARWGAFLDDVAGFDAGFFGIDAAEADVTDPHARIFLEVAHEALERAGYAGERRRGRRIGVFVAVGESGYASLLQQALDGGAAVPPSALVGNLRNLIAARVAHCLDLSGPVLAVDTACSSSLVALHLARRSLAAGECDAAVVGGVSLNLTSTGYRLLEAAQALSPTGRCRTFSSAADGFVPGEGAAALVLEPLSVAEAAGDLVLAVVRGTTVNNDGRSLSLMAPNPLLQEAVIGQAYRDAGIDPATVTYLEAHGTGTTVGDPIEARSLVRTFVAAPPTGRRWLGSVKTNVGHLLNAAGMPSLVKVVLSLTHRALPPTLHYDEPSPAFDLAGAGFEVVTELREWTADGPLRAGVNGFGFGGTNAHVILEEAPERTPPVPRPASGPHLLTLSAATESALRLAARDLAAHARAHPELDEGDLCRSASTARDHGRHRLAMALDGDLADRLGRAATAASIGAAARRRPRVAMLFSGQGTTAPGLGRGLQSQPVYRQVMEQVSEAAGEVRGRSLVAWSLDDVEPAELVRTDVAQPLLVAYGIALAAQLAAWGVRPDAVVGHSVGELAGMAASGVLTPAEAVRFAAERGRLMQDRCAPGAMASVDASVTKVQTLLETITDEVSVAAVNGPSQVVIAGPEAAVEAALVALSARGRSGHRLAVTRAFHTSGMGPALEGLRLAAGQLAPTAWRTPLLSTVNLEWSPDLDAAYFVDHARNPVQFFPALKRLLAEGYDTLVTVGPKTALRSLATTAVHAQDGCSDVAVLSTLDGSGDDAAALVGTVGRLWERGASICRPAEVPPRRRVAVPTYPFERVRHWLPDPGGTGPADRPLSGLLHRFDWRETPLPAGAVLASVGLVGAHPHLVQALSDRLARRGVAVHRCPRARLDELPPVSVLVVLAGPSAELDDVDLLDAGPLDAARTVLPLAQFLAGRPTPLVLVTEDVALTGATPERGRPGQALLAGLALALPEENRRQPVRIVDLSTLDDEQARLDALVRELDAPPAAGPAESVAWRAGRRLSRTAQLVGVGRADGPELPPDGRYLITGGAGGVGTALARALAGRGAPELYLVGRAADPPEGLVEQLSSTGARTRYLSADVAVEADVAALVAGLPRLDGVFHAAGLLDPSTLVATSPSAVAAVCAPKVRGTYLLARALDHAGNRPGTFVALSSIASALPGYAGGLGAYAAASAFLDAFAAAERHAGRPMQVLSCAAWTDTGMAASAAFRTQATVRGVPQVAAQAAVEAVLDATSVDATQLLVMGAESSDAPVEQNAPVPVAPTAPTVPVAPPPPDTPTEGTARSVRDVVADLVAAELGQRRDELDDEASLLAMGLDSLAAVDLVRKLELQLGRELPATLLFEHPSVAQLSAHLASSPAAAVPATAVPAPRPPPEATEPFPLTPVQLAFQTSGRLHPDVPAYAYLRQTVAGALDPRLLARSLSLLEDRHPMLRLRIRTVDGQPRQTVEPPSGREWPEWFEVEPLRGSLDEVEDALCNRVFDLDTEGPVRALLLQDAPDRASLLLLLHHAAADGASLNLLCAELWQVYTALSQHCSPELPSLPSTFRDYVDLSDRERASDRFASDLHYWGERLRTLGPSAGLPYDTDPGDVPAPPLTARQFGIDADLTSALRARAAALEISLFHLVLAAFVRSLAGWTDQQHVTVNVARAGRDARLPGIRDLVGPFADTLPISVEVPATEAAALPRAVQAAWRESEEHGSVATLDLARLLPAVDAAPRTVGAASFSFARFPIELPDGCPVQVVETAARTASAATRLGLVCWELDGALRFSWNYPARLFTGTTVERLADDLRAQLSAAVEPALAPPPGHSVAQRIAAQCRRTPDAVAVEDGATSLTYGGLDRAARRLAARLRADGTRPNDRVALLTQPGQATVVGLLGILYAGAAWVPLDPAHPPARLRDQAERAHATTVVCSNLTGQAAALLAPLPVVEVDADPPLDRPEVPITPPDPDAIAYVIYTSGTTGRPKGVPVTHHALSTYLDWAITTFGYRATDRMLATASICFDASVRQLLAPLLVGATVVPVSRETARDPQLLLDLVEHGRVTVWSSVPTLWEQLLRTAERQVAAGREIPDLSALRWVHVGGEALSPVPVRRWFDLFGPSQRVVNLYGPTEATINATYHVVERRPDDSVPRIPIGVPVARTVVDVVGPGGTPCAVGDPGELWVSGPGLTPGYLDDPDLTARAFPVRDGVRYYRTGDRVVRRSDGTLDFLGRTDRQVKIRGHRVEPGEVEAALRDHPAVERAAVLAQPAPGADAMRLVGYVRLRGEEPNVSSAQLRADLATRLPDYLVPAQLTVVDELPLTAAGKLDVGRLPDLAPAPSGPDRTPPQTPTEQLVSSVWQRLLGVPQVSREDDFFALGGDSIAVLEVFAQLEEQLPAVPAPRALYRHRTLAALAAAIDAADGDPSTAPRPHRVATGPFPLSASQRGFLLAEALSAEARTSWLACFRLTGELDATLFQAAVDRLVQRHPMLRTAIAADRRPPTQDEVGPPAELTVHFDTIEPDELASRLAEERRHRFAASAWPLIRLQVLRVAPGQHALVVHAHHLLGDGYSAVILAQDLLSLYDEVADGKEGGLRPLRSTFRDYVDLLGAEGQGAARTATVQAEPGPRYRPPMIRRPGTAGTDPGRVTFTLDGRRTAALRHTATVAGTTPFAPLLTAYYRVLVQLSGQADLLLGVAVTGRDHALPDLHRMVGPFATVVPVRIRGAGPDFSAQLRQVAAAVDQARGSGLTIQQRVQQAGGSAPVSSFGGQFLFSYLDFEALGPIAGRRLSLAWDDHTDLEPPRVGTDLLLTARPTDGGLQVTVRASGGVLSPAELDDLAAGLQRQLSDGAPVPPPPPAPRPRSSTGSDASRLLDAALVGYLPAPGELAARAGISATAGLRESIRSSLFPDGRPRLLEELSTPLGRSGFFCLPVFADELAPAAGGPLASDVAGAVEVAAGHGAGVVSLAGMIPALTGYGFEVVRALAPGGPRVTTGHAATAASVVRTALRALAETDTALDRCTLAVIGLGSIGWSSVQLLLALDLGAPTQLLLCDVASRAPHLTRLAEELRRRGQPAGIAVCGPDGQVPPAVYDADLVLAAVSAPGRVLDVDRLQPGTIVVDDSFPHCFDPRAATRRMADRGDVMVVGGGLLAADPSERVPVDDPLLRPYAHHLTGHRLSGTVPSCQLEALMQVARPDLAPVHGLVDVAVAVAYWQALTTLGVEAAPLHLLLQQVTPTDLRGLRGAR